MKASLQRFFRDVRVLDFAPAAAFAAITVVDVFLSSTLFWLGELGILSMLQYVGRAFYYGLFLGSAVFLLGRFARWIYVPLWVWLCFVETVEIVSRVHFHRVLDGDWLMIFLTSSMTEFGQVCGHYPLWQWGVAIGGFVVTASVGVWCFARAKFPAPTRSRVVVGAACLVPFVVCRFLLAPALMVFNMTLYTFLPVDTVHNWKLYSDVAQTACHPCLPASARIDAPQGRAPKGVIVIGESATRNNFHVYGYERPTTPNMDGHKEDLILFTNVRATHGTTGMSLRMFFTEATTNAPGQTRSTLAQRYAQAGYRCVLLSNQDRWGRWEGVETLLFSGCEEKIYLSEQHSGEQLFDEALVEPFARQFSGLDASRPGIVFLHLLGSHEPAQFRYPPDRTVYPRYDGDWPPGMEDPSETVAALIDTYDNSIVYTDRVLERMFEVFVQSKDPVFAVYFSDHGETPRSGSWRDQSSPDLFEIPFIVWFSPAYRDAFPETVSHIRSLAEKSWSAGEMLPIFLELARVVE